MTAMAARTMGYRVRVMDPEADVPRELCCGRDDRGPLGRRGRSAAAGDRRRCRHAGDRADRRGRARAKWHGIAPLRPGVEPIRIIQDKTLQKTWLAENGFPVGPFRVVRSEAELHEAVHALGGRVFLKIGRGGYDGRGQARIGLDAPAQPKQIDRRAWQQHWRAACVAEQALDLECEISVMAARNPSGEVRSYPAARNHHENQILAWSVLPAGVAAGARSRAPRRWRRPSSRSSASKACSAWRCLSRARASCWSTNLRRARTTAITRASADA